MFIDSLFFLLPSVHIRENMDINILVWFDIPIFLFASLSHAYFFLMGQKRLHGTLISKLTTMPALLATSIGLGVNNGRAVIEALIGYKTGFARTPKKGNVLFALSARSDTPAEQDISVNPAADFHKTYQTNSQYWSSLLELMLAILYSAFLVWAIYKSYWIVTPFLSLFAIGFYYTSLSSLFTGKRNGKSRQKKMPLDNKNYTGQQPLHVKAPVLATKPVPKKPNQAYDNA